MPDTYTTIQGDTFDIIAWRLWGQETMCTELMRANPDHRQTLVFEAGVPLAVPDLQRPRQTITPPWRQAR